MRNFGTSKFTYSAIFSGFQISIPLIRLSSFVYGDSGFDAMILLPSYVTIST